MYREDFMYHLRSTPVLSSPSLKSNRIKMTHEDFKLSEVIYLCAQFQKYLYPDSKSRCGVRNLVKGRHKIKGLCLPSWSLKDGIRSILGYFLFRNDFSKYGNLWQQ